MVSQKTQALASKKGFTLVELIVVITILAILGTIGFVSLQGYSAQSRDSKRSSDLRSLATAITIKSTDGMTLTSFVLSKTDRTLSGATTGSGHIAGHILNPSDTTYSAGDPNFTTLGVDAGNFVDGTNQYAIGTSTRAGGIFQLAATLEAGGTKTALVTGTYSPRNGATFSGTYTAATSGSGFTITELTGTGIGFFLKGDEISVGSGTSVPATIDTVRGDGTGFTATLSGAAPTTGSGTVSLRNAVGESKGIIAATAGTLHTTTTPVQNGSTTSLPY